jgi:Condensation domain
VTDARTGNAGRVAVVTGGPVLSPPVAERVTVDFAGDGAGVDEMSWGMWEIWHAMEAQRTALPHGGWAPLAEGTGLADVAGELRYLMSRFPSTRTRLRFDAAGRPTQELFASGRIDLEVYDAGDGDPAEVAAAVERNYRGTEFDYAGAWPVRMAVVRQHGRLTHQVVITSHLVSDGEGGSIMLRELKARETAPVTGMQQLEQARWQRSPEGQRQNDRALRHWEGILRAVPARQLPGPTDPRSPRYWDGTLCSPALTAALPVIAARTGAGLPTVRLALFAVALSRVTGINPVVVRPVVNNRFRPGLADVVCMVAQAGVCALDVKDATVDQAVERALRGTMSAYKYAYFHPEGLRELIARVSRERGEDVTVGCFVNDRSTYLPPRDDRVPTAAEEPAATLRAARGATTFRWTARQDTPADRLFVSVVDGPDGPRFEIRIDTHFISPADTEALAHGMEQAAVEAALTPAAPPAAPPDPGPVR